MEVHKIYIGKNTPANNYPGLIWSPLAIERVSTEILKKYYSKVAEVFQTNTSKESLKSQLSGRDVIIRYFEGVENVIDMKLPYQNSSISIKADSINQKKGIHNKYLGAIYLGADKKYYLVISSWCKIVQPQYIELHPKKDSLRTISLSAMINNRKEAFYVDDDIANNYQKMLDIYLDKILKKCKNKSMKECAKIVVNEMKKVYKEVYNEIPVVVIVDEQTGEEEEIWPDMSDSSIELF